MVLLTMKLVKALFSIKAAQILGFAFPQFANTQRRQIDTPIGAIFL